MATGAPSQPPRVAPRVAYVLGGGGLLGAVQVGMLQALADAGVRPDVIVGTSVGAINGAVYAAAPDTDGLARLERLWTSAASTEVFAGSTLQRMSTLARSRTHAHSSEPLRRFLETEVPATLFEDLAVPLQCVAASIERAAEQWFSSGPLVPAILASCAVPGLLPPVRIGDEHFVDGGLVHSIPVGRALALGAQQVYVLHVGRVDRQLTPPAKPWEVAAVAFEIARRHRFASDLAATPEGVLVHLLPTGDEPPRYADLSALRYRDTTRIRRRIEGARAATAHYLRHPVPFDAGGARLDADAQPGPPPGADGIAEAL
jgi:NTE family protein